MNSIIWKQTSTLLAGTTLRDAAMAEEGNLALHTGGDKVAILENREHFAKQIDVPTQNWVCAKQTHSDHLQLVTAADKGRGATQFADGIDDCDALYTKDSGVLLTVMTADCVPILLYDRIAGLVCAIHAGWLGTVKEITAKVIKHLVEVEHCDPRHLHAFIGPSISAASFEVGMDVVEQVKAMSFPTEAFINYAQNDKAFVDNKGLNKKMLLDAGLLEHHITVDKNDTFNANAPFFSYRRDHDCGRHMSYIMMK